MAARTRKVRHDDETRRRIKTSQLLNRLTAHSLAPKPIMDASQVTAALGVLKKTLPDLAAIQHSGDASAPFVLTIAAPQVDD